MKLITEEFSTKVFFLPYKLDKSEGVWVKPMTRTIKDTLHKEALQEAGHDQQLTDDIFTTKALAHCIVDWVGFTQADGEEIKYSKDLIKPLFEYQTRFFKDLLLRIEMVANLGEVDAQKN